MTKTTTYRRPQDVTRALHRLPDVAARELERASQDNAGDLGPAIRSAGARLGGVAPYVAASVRVDGATVVVGSEAPLPSGRATVGDVLFGAEFGSDAFAQFQPWRGAGDGAGYFIWPTVDAESGQLRDAWSEALADALDKV